MHEGPLAGMDRADLCTVGRELMLAAHLQDRAGAYLRCSSATPPTRGSRWLSTSG